MILDNPAFKCLVFFVAALVFSLIINGLLLKFVRTLGIRNQGEALIRWSPTSRPALGGISFYIIFLFSLISFSFLNPETAGYFNLRILGLILAVSIGFLLGLFDDAYNTRPWIKFFTQVLCGLVLIVSGIHIVIFESNLLNYALTLFWVVGIMNSINMLDNMDGITAVVSLGILLAMLVGLLVNKGGITPMMTIMVGVIAALAGFLFYNWSPAKMYMGDTGSQFLGVLLAGLAIMYFWNGAGVNGEKNHVMQLMAVVIAFSLPIIDTTTVFIKRIARGNSPFVGGKDHTTHHMAYLGYSDKQVGLIFVFFSLLSAGITIFITTGVETWKLSHTLFSGTYFLLLFSLLFTIATKSKPAKSRTP